MSPPTINERLSDQMIDEILGGFKGYTESPVARLAREARDSRKLIADFRAELHRARHDLGACLSVLGLIQLLVLEGSVDLPGDVRELLEERIRVSTDRGETRV